MLVVAWSPISNLIASGSEDCHFKIWDPMGQLLFKSAPRLYPITSIAWSPDGAFCAFTTFSSVCVSSAYGVRVIFSAYKSSFQDKGKKKLISSIVLNVCRFRMHSHWQSDILEGSMDGDGISSVCWSPEGSQLVVGNSTGRIQISHLVKGCVRNRLRSALLSITWNSSFFFLFLYLTY